MFGEATFDLGDRTRLVAGGRYSHDARIGKGRYFDGEGLSPYDYDEDFSRFDYKAGIEYDLTDSAMLYAVTQTGFQPGTFNGYASTPSLSNAVKSADMTAYSAGIKSRWLDDRLQVNNEVFYYDYNGLIISAYNTNINATQTFNADKVRIYGDQLDVIFLPTVDDKLTVSVGYLHARNVNFDLPDGTASYDGYQLQYAPDWTLNAGYSHDFHFGPGYLRAGVGTRYESEFYADFLHTPGGVQRSYWKTDASVTYYAADGRWSFGGWVRNIENVTVLAATAGGSQFPPLTEGATAFLEPPRTYGLRATFAFR
jgi:iron complex outermembrane receptor protein